MTRSASGTVRNRNLRLLVSVEERKMVQEIADDQGLSVADTIRQLIRERWAETRKKKR